MFIIDDALLDEIRERADIVDLIGEYVNLKRSGSNYMGLCPFHGEKTPSFSVSPSKRIFKCFGCGEGGDVISFIMKRENLGFRDAVKFLADRYNIQVQEYHDENKKLREKKERFYEMNREAAKFFFENMRRSQLAQSYLKNRKIDPKTITKFAIGYAKNDWDSLKNHMLTLGYSEEEMVELNLLSKGKNNRTYDRFRNRIIFPIINPQGKVLGFGGRVLDQSLPKYLNSTDTLVFHKGSNLYNLNIVSKEQDRKKIILVEGYMDVISLYKSGINYSVASLGTSLTLEQAKLIKRYGKEVLICYDGDSAGIRATDRAIDILLSVGISPGIVQLDENLDPDDYIEKYGIMNFEIKCNEAIFYLDFKIDQVKKNFDLQSPQGLGNFTMEAAKIFARIKNPIEQDIYIDRFSRKYNVSISAIKNYINYLGRTNRKKAQRKPKSKTSDRVVKDGTFKAQLELLRYALESKENFDLIYSRIEIIDFPKAQSRILFEELQELYKLDIVADDIIEQLLQSSIVDKNFLQKVINTEVNFYKATTIIPELITRLKKSRLEKEKEDCLAKITTLQSKEPLDREALRQVLALLNEINYKMNKLNEGVLE
ncbi:MAG: DNA primase [Tissierellia bacterium]|nr:DNA primase [Tissierellia bacterium]